MCVCAHAKSLNYVRLFAIIWTVPCQAPLAGVFSRHEYWSGLSCTPPGDLPHPQIEPASPAAPALQADYLPPSHQGSPYVCMPSSVLSNLLMSTEAAFKSLLF